MKILLHICCGPCTIYPLEILRDQGHSVSGFFFNPNIHPYKEYQRRLGGVEDLSKAVGLPVEYVREYGLKNYLRQVVFHEHERCAICYTMRLAETVKIATQQGADAFSTTLLYSRYQNHAKIIQVAEELSAESGVPFYYQDFRVGWQHGIDKSKEMELYRQPYCGCIYSEQERYDKSFRKKLKQ